MGVMDSQQPCDRGTSEQAAGALIACPDCRGRGRDPHDSTMSCHRCGGVKVTRMSERALTTGTNLIRAERARQQSVEGWTIEHDREHGPVILAAAAECYRRVSPLDNSPAVPAEWPWGVEWWKPKGVLRNLIRAGALYLAASEVSANPGEALLLGDAATRCARSIDVLIPEFLGIFEAQAETGKGAQKAASSKDGT